LQQAQDLGIDAVVEKPIHREELLSIMQHSLARPDEIRKNITPRPV
jgi:AmiR/NasT family two-component response regulator